ncbi:hypothetical protein FRC04_004862 [Tulasnella sp. 424]|nr:hypothetical protein FRC04_004862 [Tulasnella sp. 424]
MAASAPSSPFLDHLLTLLASYASGIPLPPAYSHTSSKEAAVEQAIAELAKRLKRPLDVAARSATSNGGSSMDWNPPETQTPDSAPGASSGDGSHASQGVKNPSSYSCPTCGRAPYADSLATTTSDHHAGGPAAISATDELQLLKAQVQDVARVCKAVANGDLTQKITVPVQDSVMVQLKEVINTMVERLAEFASEVTRVSDEVGTQGILGGQVSQDALGGTRQDLCRTVNRLATNLTMQVRAVAEVTKAVALGDLSRMIEIDAQGEILELKTIVNSMVIQLRKFAVDVSRASDLEAWTFGTLGGQTDVPDLEGEWRQLSNNVNKISLNSTLQVRSIAAVIAAVAKGDLTKRIEIEFKGEMGDLKELINEVVEQLNTFTSEVNRVALEVGTMGVLGGQAQVRGAQGTWADLTNNVNKMADSLATQVRSIANVTKAVASGDLQQTVQVDAQGEMLDLKNTVNSMVRQLYTLANEITRVSLEVGMEGKLGGQVVVEGVEGMWEVLTNSVNMMVGPGTPNGYGAMNLTTQVRSIDEVTKAVAHGDLTKRMEFPAMGELLELKHTVNGMVESLSTSAAGVSHS